MSGGVRMREVDQLRVICNKSFKDCETEQELNGQYNELREVLVCEMSDRAEEIGLDPDTL